MTYVDIAEYCTAKWITRNGIIPEGIEEVTLDEKYLHNEKIEGKGFSFLPPSSGNDIIQCLGQNVNIPQKTVRQYIDIGGFAVYGDFRDDFIFNYEDNSSEIVKLSFADVLCTIEYLIGEDREKYCKRGERFFAFSFLKAGNERDGVLFAYRVPLPKDKKLVGITLPENFFVNICGITLR